MNIVGLIVVGVGIVFGVIVVKDIIKKLK